MPVLASGQKLNNNLHKLNDANGAAVTASTTSLPIVTNGNNVLVCHLAVTNVSGTSPSMTIKFQDSADGTNWVDIPSGAFTAATTPGNQRLVITGVGELVQAVVTITGTTPSFKYNLHAIPKG